MKLRLFTLFLLATLIVTMAGTALAQGPLPPADNDNFVLPSKSELPLSSSEGRQAGENSIADNVSTLAAGSITNGGFEQGAVGWSQSSSHGYALIYQRTTNFPIPTHAGTWVAWLGGDDNETAALSQAGIVISNPVSKLYLWYWIGAKETNCAADKAYVVINNMDTVYTWDLCAANNTSSWKNLGIDLSAYNGQTITLSIVIITNAAVDTYSSLLIDDVTLGGSFADVPTTHIYFNDIETLYANGLTGGCATNPLKFCPDQIMNRGQAAVFMLRANFGSGYVPPTPTHYFQDDWSQGTWAETWAEGMLNEGLSAGCLASPPKFCPWSQIPREQAVIFALRMKYGTLYTPPAATGTMFADMTDPNYYATSWAEQAYVDGLIPNCGTSGGKPKICPKDLVSRGLGSYMIVRAKSLTMP